MSCWEPCGHVPPRKPIELNPRHPVTIGVPMSTQAAQHRAQEAERIWKITRAVAEGTNPPTVGQE